MARRREKAWDARDDEEERWDAREKALKERWAMLCVVSVEPRVQTSKAQPAVGTAIVVLWTDWLA